MACGKTTLGRAIEAAGAAEFIDLDEYITEKSGLTPAQWFARHGEEGFRKAEQTALAELISRPTPGPTVIATGGGTPANGEAMSLMLGSGTVVWLDASIERTISRLLDALGQRPIVAGMDERALREFIPGHLSARRRHYERAHARFDSSYLDTEDEVGSTTWSFIGRFLSPEP